MDDGLKQKSSAEVKAHRREEADVRLLSKSADPERLSADGRLGRSLLEAVQRGGKAS
jgi:hypothetical protein